MHLKISYIYLYAYLYRYIGLNMHICVCILCFISFKLASDGTAQRPACSAAERMACCLVTFDLSYCVREDGQAGQRLKQTRACNSTDSDVTASFKQSCRSTSETGKGGRRKHVGPNAGS